MQKLVGQHPNTQQFSLVYHRDLSWSPSERLILQFFNFYYCVDQFGRSNVKLLPSSLLICTWMLTNKRFETAALLACRREEQAYVYFMDFLDECEGN